MYGLLFCYDSPWTNRTDTNCTDCFDLGWTNCTEDKLYILYILGIYRGYIGHILVITWAYLGKFLGISGNILVYLGYIFKIICISWVYHGHILGISWAYLGNILGISWAYLGNILEISWAYLGISWVCFGHLGCTSLPGLLFRLSISQYFSIVLYPKVPKVAKD